MRLTYDDDDPNQEKLNHTKEDLIQRSKVFITCYTKKCEEELKAYQKELEAKEKKKGTEKFHKIRENPLIPANLKIQIKNFEGKIFHNFPNRTEKIKFFKEIRKDDLRKIFVEAGGYIFWSYQNQFKDVTDIHGNKTSGMKKLAIDAVDRTFDFINNCESENLETCFINIAISAIFGASKTFKVIKGGETIKYKGRECQTAWLYENVSIIKENISRSKVQYKKSITKHDEYGSRLASSEEACHLSKYKKCEWDVVDTRENEILTIDDMKPYLDEILNNINNKKKKKDTLLLQETTKNNTDELITNTTKNNQKLEMANKTIGEIKTVSTVTKQNLEMANEIKTISTDTKQTLGMVYETVGEIQTEIEQNQMEMVNVTTTINNNILAEKEYFSFTIDRTNRIIEMLENIKFKYILIIIFLAFTVVIWILYKDSIKTDLSNILLDTSNVKDQLEKSSKNNLLECSRDKELQDVCVAKQIPGPIWFDIKEPVKSFTGRVEQLKSLHEALQNYQKEQVALSQTAVITGLGGIGKTELARKYIYDYKTNYTNVIWIKSETQQIFKESFHKVAIKLNISIKEGIKIVESERDLTSIIEDIYLYFNHTKTLTIFDNIEKLDDIKQFLDLSLPLNIAKPFLLITSRNQEWKVGEEGTIEIIKLNEFTQDESNDFIRKSLLDVNSTNEEVNELSNELQNFPLALNQATSYINMMNKQLTLQGKQRFGINDYLSLYHDNKSKLLKFKPNIGYERYFDTVYTTWIVTLQKIEENENALNIIQFMAYLKPDSLDVDLCFSNYFQNKDDLWCAIGLLHQYSMINIVNGTANIDRLVQEIIRIKLNYEKKQEEVLSKALEIMSPSENDSIYKELSLHSPLRSIHKNDERNIFQHYFKYKYDKGKRIPFNLLECGNLKTLYYALTFQEIQEMKDIADEDVKCRNILMFVIGHIYCCINIALIFCVVKSGMLKSQYYILYLVMTVVILISLFFFTFLLYSLILQYENLCSLISFVPKLL